MIAPPSITAVLAVYGAVLSTIAIVRQIVGDRVKVRLKVQKGMEMVGDPRYHGMVLTILTVTNMGERPVTIKAFGAMRLHPNTTDFVAVDSRPHLPCEITEGKYITSIWDQSSIDFSTIDYWAAWDTRDKIYRCPEASRLKHWKSELRRRIAFHEKKAESAAEKQNG
jgi:hypothetical protein